MIVISLIGLFVIIIIILIKLLIIRFEPIELKPTISNSNYPSHTSMVSGGKLSAKGKSPPSRLHSQNEKNKVYNEIDSCKVFIPKYIQINALYIMISIY